MPESDLRDGIFLVRFTQEEVGLGVCEDIEHCLEAALSRMPTGVRWILLDLEGVRFMRSSGLGALLSLCERLKGQGVRVAACRVPPFGRNLFKISRLDEVLPVYPGVPEAMDALRSPAGPGDPAPR